MKFGTTLASLVVASVVALSGAQHKPDKMAGGKMTKAQWQKMYNEAEKMFAKKDADALFGYMAPDFSMTSQGHTMTGDQAKASMKEWFGMMKTLHAKMTVTKVENKNGMTVVTDHFNMSGMTMPDPKTHKSGKLVDTGTEMCTWTNMNGKWMMKSIVSKDEKMTMNGKPFTPPKQ